MTDATFSLTLTQQDIYFDQLHYPNNPLYNIGGYIRFGKIDVQRVTRVHQKVVEGHDAFGIRLISDESGIKQTIVKQRNCELPFHDFSGDEDSRQSADQWMTELFETPLEIENSELFRAYLLKLSENEYWYVGFAHHLCLDGWGFANWAGQLGRLYNDEHALVEQPTQWYDIAQGDGKYVGGTKYQKDQAYWAEHLPAVPAKLLSPTSNKMADQLRSVRDIVELPPARVKQFKALADECGVGINQFFLTTFALYFSTIYQRREMVFGIPTHNRKTHAQKQTVGVFTSVNPLMLNIDPAQSFAEMAKQIFIDQKAVYRSQRFPIGHITKNLGISGDVEALYDVRFNYLKLDSNIEIEGEKVELVYLSHNHEATPISITVWEYGDSNRLEIQIDYKQSYFDEQTIRFFKDRIEHLLTLLLEHSQTPLSQLNLLPSDETRQLMLWSQPKITQPSGFNAIHELFEQQVEANPDAVAVEFEGATLSYGVLNQKANQLAHYLIEQGVKPGDLVGICVERSLAMIIGLLGALKAGSAYISLDPAYPEKRIQYMLEDSKVAVVLTQQHLQQRFDFKVNELFCLDSSDAVLSHFSAENIISESSRQDLAYVLYTSGSTGLPKGVMIQHSSVLALVDWLKAEYNSDELHSVLCSTSINFDLFVFELWSALACGNRLLLVSNILQLADQPDLRPTLVNTVPSAVKAVLDANLLPQTVKVLNVAGEPLKKTLVNEAFDTTDVKRVINLYGPSEDTTYSTYAVFNGKLDSEPTIGRPVDNSYALVLNESLQLTPMGLMGELHLGGEGLARGYLNRDELTAEKFIQNPFSEKSGDLLYKTGDLVRWLPDGKLEYNGRMDHQVKIRGFRIELGEIEADLLRHEQVDNAVAIVTETPKQIVANVAGHGENLTQILKPYLQKVLPEYMVPAVFIELDELPMTPNGKIDRSALPLPDSIGLSGAAFEAPKTALQQTLCNIWQKVLGLEKVGISDNFFAIGGDSILSIQIISEARKAGILISARQLFEHKTIVQLALHVDQQSAVHAPQGQVEGEQTLLPIHQRFLTHDSNGRDHYNQSVLLHTPADFNFTHLAPLITALYQRHDALRLQLDGCATYRALESKMVTDAISEVDMRGLSDTERADILAQAGQAAQAGLSLAKGELLKAVYFAADDDANSRLLLVIHHLAVDGVSWRILLGDLAQAYQQFKANQRVELAAKSSSMQQWGEYLAGFDFSDEKDYWEAQVETSVQALPLDHPQATDTSHATSQKVAVELAASDTKALLSGCHHAYGTQINDLLLTSLVNGMNKWTGHQNLRIDLEGHGRELLTDTADLSQTVGWFTSIYPLILRTEDTVAAAIKGVKEQLRKVPQNGIGFGWQNLESEPSKVVFNYLGQFEQDFGDFSLAEEFAGEFISAKRKRDHDLSFNVMVKNGHLSIELDHNSALFDQTTMRALLGHITLSLHDIIEHCQSQKQSSFTPSDFPLSNVSQSSLDKLQTAYPKMVGLYPSTPMQRGMLFHTNQDAAAYVTQISLDLAQDLDVDTFKSVWQQVGQRHAVFRTVFVGEKLEQLVLSEANLLWFEADWSGEGEGEQWQAMYQKHAKQDKAQGFNVEQAPLMRFSLLKQPQGKWRMLWSCHHALLDGWSISLIFDEVIRCYLAAIDGVAVSLSDAPVYENYITWLSKQDSDAAKTYWQQNLMALERPTQISQQKIAAQNLTDDSEQNIVVAPFSLDSAFTDQLQALAQRSNATLNTVIQAAWAYLLHRYSGDDCIVFGETVAGRPGDLAQVEKMVGLFINSLPVCVEFNQPQTIQPQTRQPQTIADWLQSLYQASLVRHEQGFLPLNEIQSVSRLSNGESLFESLLVFENYPVDQALKSEVRERLNIDNIHTDELTGFPLTLQVLPADGLDFVLSYDSNKFTETAIKAMMGHLHNILGQMLEVGANKSDLALAELPLGYNGKTDFNILPKSTATSVQAAYVAPRTDNEKILTELWAGLLTINAQKLSVTANFFELGGDSIMSMQLVSRALNAGLQFTTKDLFKAQTIEKLAERVTVNAKAQMLQTPSEGQMPLLPIHIQQLESATHTGPTRTGPIHTGQAHLLTAPASLDEQPLHGIVASLYHRHDALRLKFVHTDSVWSAHFVPFDSSMVSNSIEMKTLSDGEIKAYARQLLESLEPQRGLLFKAACISSKGAKRLLIVSHGLVDDSGVSILCQDIKSLFEQYTSGKPLKLAAKTSGYQQWSAFLHEHANSETIQQQRDHWLDAGKTQLSPIQMAAANLEALAAQTPSTGSASLSFTLDKATTAQLLKQTNQTYRSDTVEVLLSALLSGVHQFTGESSIRLELQDICRQGMDDTLDVSQTLGCFTTEYPLNLSLDNGLDQVLDQGLDNSDIISAVKEQYRGVDNHGIGFGLLKYLVKDADVVAQAVPELAFDFHGECQADLKDNLQEQTRLIAVGAKTHHALKMSGSIVDDCLTIDLCYDRARYAQAAMGQMMQNINSALEQYIEHCVTLSANGGRGRYTPIDFPMAKVSQQELDEWQGEHEISQLYPATGMQQGMLFHSMLTSGTYVTQNLLSFDDLNVPAFKRAWQQVIRRHEVFRTAFMGLASGNTHQQVMAEVDFLFDSKDLSSLDSDTQAAQIELLQSADKTRGFEPTEAPLMRMTLLDIGDGHQKLLWSYHHALLDGWCLSLIISEVSECYRCFTNEGSDEATLAQPQLSPAPAYSDYGRWLAAQDMAQAETYWAERLSDIEGPTPLPLAGYDKNHLNQGDKLHYQRLEFTAGQTERIAQMANAAHTTVNVVLQAAWALLLSRYSSEQQVVFGTVTSGRPAQLPGAEQMVGLFINTLPVVVDVSSNLQTDAFLQQIHTQQVDGELYSYLPLNDIQQLSSLSAPAKKDLFDSILVYQNYPIDEDYSQLTAKAGLNLRAVETFGGTNYGLCLIAHLGETLTIDVEARQSQLSETSVKQIVSHLQRLIVNLTDAGQTPLRHIEMLDRHESDYLQVTLNQPCGQYPHDRLTHGVFEVQAQKHPTHIAVLYESQSLTYRELNEQANQLAHCLIEAGVKTDTLVGLCMSRSVEMMVAVLGILKAGGAYVPLDPNYPAARLDHILQDTGLKHLVRQSTADIAVSDDVQQFELDNSDFQLHLNSLGIDNPAVAEGLNPASLAYVIYTSGSTGQPKGVMQTHENVIRLFDGTQAEFKFDANDVWTLFHSIAFDFTVWELWGAMLHGGKLVIPTQECTRDPQLFVTLCQAQGVTVLNQTPSAFKSFTQVALSVEGGLPALRFVVFGGEALQVSSLTSWWDHFGQTQPQLVNMYGITETTVHVSYKSLTREDCGQSTIGRRLSDQALYLLDSDMSLVPLGAVGEIYVGGAGLARGYLNQPTLTAERFVKDCFSTDSTARLYRTGDLARYLPNRELDFIGRVDSQVKIRGFRIELGEVEHQLAAIPGVKDSLVLAIDDMNDGDKRLVAYVVPRDDSAQTDKNELINGYRDQMQQKLPEHMVPSVFVVLEHMPLTTNGKIDRKALPEPASNDLVQAHYEGPRNPTEKILCDVWQNVLGVERVGINDNFFSLGGDSILCIRIVSKLNKAGVIVAVKDIFSHQSIAGLSLALSTDAINTVAQQQIEPFSMLSEAELTSIDPEYQHLYDDIYPMSELQLGMVFHSQVDTIGAVYHDIFSFHFRLEWDQPKFTEALSRMFAEHPVLRSAYDLAGDRSLQKIHKHMALPLHCNDIRNLSSDEQSSYLDDWIETEKCTAFDWNGPLIRIFIHRRSDTSFETSISFHHAVYDGWSLSLFISQLFGYYQTLLNGSQLVAVEPEFVFRDFVSQEQQVLGDEKAKNYWIKLLEDAPMQQIPRNPIELDPKRERKTRLYVVEEFRPLANQLYQLANQLGVPLQSVLLTAHCKVLTILSGQSKALTLLVANGRPEYEGGDRGLGLFLNALPMCFDMGERSWASLIKSVASQVTESMEYRLYPSSAISRDSNANFDEVSFNYTHFHSYQELMENSDLELLDSRAFEQTNFDFAIDFTRETVDSDQLSFSLSYDTDLYDAELVSRIGVYYVNAFAAMLLDVNQDHNQCSLLAEAEKIQLLEQYSTRLSQYDRDLTVHQLFARQAAAYPNKVALQVALLNDDGQIGDEQNGVEQISYAELDKKANQLAHYLIEQGVVADTLVGLCVERSMDTYIGLLAILKAGGAYVPLDPKYPLERLNYMVKDSGLGLLLTHSKLADAVPLSVARTICLDDADFIQNIAANDITPPKVAVYPDNLVYVIYTSGSTGQPKGVQILHQNLVSYCEVIKHDYHMDESDKVLQFSSFSFDIAVEEFCASLLGGATLILRNEAVMAGGEVFWQFMIDNDVSMISLPTAFWHELCAQKEQLQMIKKSALKLVVVGGEAMSRQAAIQWTAEVGDNVRVLNTYGPTEATIVASVFDIAGDGEQYPDLPIGKPAQNSLLYVLDSALLPVSAGVTGELYIGGDRLARGYLNQAQLTDEKFIDDPFSDQPNARMYRTGDLVRWLGDGNLAFMGRVDEQVKIRGFRVELGEIEHQICGEDSVQSAVVLSKNDPAGEMVLVAYVVPSAGYTHEHLSSALKTALGTRIPEYMVPGVIVVIEQLPVTSTGKLDKRALPEPDFALQLDDYVAPQTETEKHICGMWQELLGLERVGVHDKFFEIGGNSLLVIRGMGQLRQHFKIDLTIGELFSLPSVYELSGHIDAEVELNAGLQISKDNVDNEDNNDNEDSEKWEF